MSKFFIVALFLSSTFVNLNRSFCKEIEKNCLSRECVCYKEIINNEDILTQRDTTGREKRERTETERVRKPTQRKPDTSKQDSEEEDSFWGSCLSSCIVGLLSDIISGIFSSEKEKEKIEEPVVIVSSENKSKESRIGELPPEEYERIMEDTLKDSLAIRKYDSTMAILKEDTLSKQIAAREVQSILKKEYINPTIPIHWERFHLGLMLGGTNMWGVEKDEYNLLNLWLRIIGGFLLSKNFEINLHTNFGWYSGTPEFDYITKTIYPSGDVREIINVPEKISFKTTSYGIGFRWLVPFSDEANSILGLILGVNGCYVKFYEKSKVFQKEYFNRVLEKQETKEIKREFNKISYEFDLGIFLTDRRSSWWWEFLIGLEIFGFAPTKSVPFSLDWSGYSSQFFFGIGVKYRIFEL